MKAKRTLRQDASLAFYCFFFCFLGLLCADKIAVAQEETDQPRLVVTIEPDGTINGSYEKDGYSIFLEALRGEKNIGDDPDMQPYELDIRVLDNNKNPFLFQNSGVSEDTVDTTILGTEEDREEAMAMLPDAIRELKETYVNIGSDEQDTGGITGLTDDNRWEILAIIELMRSASEDSHFRTEKNYNSSPVMLKSSSYRYSYDVKIMKKKVFLPPSSEHSALLVQYCDNKKKICNQVYSCNHGNCANSRTMSKKCSKTFYSNALITMKDKPCDKYTFYGVHTCNSDTRVQYLAFKKGFYDYYNVACINAMDSAPKCD